VYRASAAGIAVRYHPNQLLLRWRVASIDYNVPLNPSLFRLTVPSGYKLVRGR